MRESERGREGGGEGGTHLFNVGIDERPGTDHLMSVDEISHLSNNRLVLHVCVHMIHTSCTSSPHEYANTSLTCCLACSIPAMIFCKFDLHHQITTLRTSTDTRTAHVQGLSKSMLLLVLQEGEIRHVLAL